MTRLIPIALLGLLAACGVDGAPLSPREAEEKERERGVTVSGSVSAGVSGTL